jgi:O-acetyl-ADP-ribose deacetylase (regulator of RNase III)
VAERRQHINRIAAAQRLVRPRGEHAAGIALDEIARFLNENSGIEKVTIVCFDERTLGAYMEALNKLKPVF